MDPKPRIYLHPNGETISIGFEDTNDTLLFIASGDNWRDKVQLAKWVKTIEFLENENLKLREQLSKIAGGAETIEMESGVNPELEGFITIRWGSEVGQLSPDEARSHGLVMLQVAEAAESDALILRALKAEGFDMDAGFGLLRMIREYRAKD